MNDLYTTFYGSELYGTNLPTSDVDIVTVYAPTIDDVLIGKDSRSSQDISTSSDVTKHSILSFVKGLKSGNATMLEILFSGLHKSSTIYHHPMWIELLRNIPFIASQRCESMIGYCRAQAKMYDTRGDRLAAVIAVKESMTRFNESASDWQVAHYLDTESLDKLMEEHPANIDIEDVDIGSVVKMPHLVVSGKKIPATASLKIGIQILENREKEYGKRVKTAMDSSNIDWKGMMHAVRISEQTLQYLNSGTITFPRPNAGFLKDIRLGNVNYDLVTEMIQKNLVDIEEARAKTTLRAAPDEDFLDLWTIGCYRYFDRSRT